MWKDSTGVEESISISRYPNETQITFSYNATSGGHTDVGSLNINEWNYIAAVYDYGLGITCT